LSIPKIDIIDFDYNLPNDKIALFPTTNREASKLLVAETFRNTITHSKFSDIDQYIPENSLLVLNNTKVIAARLLVAKPTGGKAEILCTEPISPSFDPQITMTATKTCIWKCIIGGRSIKEGMILKPLISNKKIDVIQLDAEVMNKNGMDAIVKFQWNSDIMTFADILSELGTVPLPPYINRNIIKEDKERYQTVYANNDGSVAAPTAGLHFSHDVLEKIKTKNIHICNLTLHVGVGTFKPVDDDGINNHDMHEEQIFVTKDAIDLIYSAFKENKKIITVGTTSLRTLETLYRIGINLFHSNYNNFANDGFFLDQWEVYYQMNTVSPELSFASLLNYMDDNNIQDLHGKTKLLILPGYEINTISGLITNFHLPRSTLLMLVGAFIGEDFRKIIYQEALNMDYRFLSYGDSSILLK